MAGVLKRWRGPVLLAGWLAVTVLPAKAQSPPSSTLRYGSGYLEVPAAGVLPAAALRAGYAAFLVGVDSDPAVDASGAVSGPGGAPARVHGDAFLAIGILGRGEVGASLQSISSGGNGAGMWGAFGKLLLLDPRDTGLGLAVGARYLGAPDFQDGVRHAPTRLGFPDARARARYSDGRELDTRLTLYSVATLRLPGIEAPWFPDNDVSLSLGYGTGMFREGGDLAWYAPEGTGGWFMGGGMELELGPGTLLVLEAEHAGFDVNLGAELAHRNLRVGIQVLGVNHGEGASTYRSRKLGVSMSLTACPLMKSACVPRLRSRAVADTVRLPAPPPDTVVFWGDQPGTTRGIVPPGRPVALCLANGEDVWVMVTASGDILPGLGRAPSSPVMPGGVLDGRYAGSQPHFSPAAALVVGGLEFRPEGDPSEPSCAAMVPWAELEGVPVFRLRDGGDEPDVVLLPIRPGVWQRYRRISS